MTVTIVALDRVLSKLGMAATDPRVPEVNGLLLAVSSEIRRLTTRAFEGTPTCYLETLEPDGRTLRLPHVPVTDVLSVRPVPWDGTIEQAYDPTDVVGGASTTLAATAAAGATNLRVATVAGLDVGGHLRVGSGLTRETVRITAVGTAGAGGTGVTVEPALGSTQASGGPVVAVAGSTAWRVMSYPFGRLELAYLRRFVAVSYRVTGEIPDHISQAGLDWLEARWRTPASARAGLTSYRTGDDSETYSDTVRAGTPPRDVLRALGLERHHRGAVI